MIAIRVTDKLFSSGKQSQTGGLWFEIGPQNLFHWTNCLLEINLKLHFGTKKMHWFIMWLTSKIWIVRYRYIFSTATSLSVIFRETSSTKFITDAIPKSDRSYKRYYCNACGDFKTSKDSKGSLKACFHVVGTILRVGEVAIQSRKTKSTVNGDLMHQEYDRKLKSQYNEFVLLKCRTTYDKGACNNVRVWLDKATK